jgi:hypothetical protein
LLATIGGFIADIPSKLTDKLEEIGNAAAKIGAKIVSALAGAMGSLGTTVLGIVAEAINTGIVDPLNSLINSAVGLEKKIPGSPDLGIDKNPIPRIKLGAGGIVTRPTIALIGERGPEAVVPLGRGAGAMGGNTFIVNNNQNMDPRAVARAWLWQSKNVVA